VTCGPNKLKTGEPKMKKSFVSIVAVITLGLPIAGFAAEKKAAAEGAKKGAEKAVAAASGAPEKVVGEGKAIPMHVRADAIDAKAKTFTMKKKDGTEVKHVLTDSTTIMNGEAKAKLEDVKVGEYVSGLRKKKSETEYEVVKITKFGPAPEKKPAGEEKAAKPDAKKKAE
jgi:hypothetical protein